MSRPSTLFFKPVCCAVLLACALVAPAGAAGNKKKPIEEAGTPMPGKVSFSEAPSHETAATRDKRLRRECRGKPNAGMCLGHVR